MTLRCVLGKGQWCNRRSVTTERVTYLPVCKNIHLEISPRQKKASYDKQQLGKSARLLFLCRSPPSTRKRSLCVSVFDVLEEVTASAVLQELPGRLSLQGLIPGTLTKTPFTGCFRGNSRVGLWGVSDRALP